MRGAHSGGPQENEGEKEEEEEEEQEEEEEETRSRGQVLKGAASGCPVVQPPTRNLQMRWRPRAIAALQPAMGDTGVDVPPPRSAAAVRPDCSSARTNYSAERAHERQIKLKVGEWWCSLSAC